MFNKKLFESICNLTCEKEDFNFNPANQRKVQYDLEDPFIKYYSYDSIVKAFNKYINKNGMIKLWHIGFVFMVGYLMVDSHQKQKVA